MDSAMSSVIRSESLKALDAEKDDDIAILACSKSASSLSAAAVVDVDWHVPATVVSDLLVVDDDGETKEEKKDDADLVLPLNNEALSLGSTKVSLPTYDRSALTAGILHLGVGNFHRSHQATYLDDLFHADFENNKQWGIVGGGIMSFDADKRTLLECQDWLQTLVSRDGQSSSARVIGSMIDFLPVTQDGAALIEAMTSENIKIVSLTVTEGGYFLNDGQFDPNHHLIQYDITHPETPKTLFGMIIKSLKIRKESGLQPFTVMSCDNIPHNGDVVRSVLLGLASATDLTFASWMETNVACPNSMVDRITPGTTSEQRTHVREELGYDDAAPIFCEPYRQWVLEDNFPTGRPALEVLDNVSFVKDVSPWEFMKIRILNGGHASMCYPAALLGVKFVHEAMDHPIVGPFLNALERSEIIPTVGPVPDQNLEDYWSLIEQRFGNPSIMDTVPRICFGGASNQPKFTIPVASDNLQADRSVDGIALVSAMWCRYCRGTTESGEEIAPNDPQWDRLNALAAKAKDDPKVWLKELPDVYGDVGTNETFVEAFVRAYEAIEGEGVEAAMKTYIDR